MNSDRWGVQFFGTLIRFSAYFDCVDSDIMILLEDILYFCILCVHSIELNETVGNKVHRSIQIIIIQSYHIIELIESQFKE